jgi:hypothetical protein
MPERMRSCVSSRSNSNSAAPARVAAAEQDGYTALSKLPCGFLAQTFIGAGH